MTKRKETAETYARRASSYAYRAARASGASYFYGSSCLRGHDGLRYTSSRECATCADLRSLRNYRLAHNIPLDRPTPSERRRQACG